MEYALVLIAMNIRCELANSDDGYDLTVLARDAGEARTQIRLYVQENQGRAYGGDHQFSAQDGLTCAWLYAVTILTVYILQRDQLFSIDWEQVGMSQAGLIRGGEWWRAVTALGLHVDTVHLSGNLIFGLLFVFLTGEMLGWGLAWSGIVLAGSLGNLINAFSRAPTHASIGASTAIFAAVGILAAFSWSRHRTRMKRWVPLGGGVAVLAFVGMGGERTDIFAHFAGFGSGCLFGFAFGLLETYFPLTVRHKQILGFAASMFFVFAWALALQSNI
jgi:rhomboid protease GluP